MTAREPEQHRATTADDLSAELHLLRASEYAAIEPWALLQAIRGPNGRIVDFVYHDINPAAASHQHRERAALIGRSVSETLPEVSRIGLIEQYAHCVETGEPLILDDLPYTGNTLDGLSVELRRYELRGVRVDSDYLSLTWRDVNQRYLTHQQVTESEERFRLLAENSSDVVVHIRNLAVAWISPSVEDNFGAPPGYWIGQPVESIVVSDDLPVFAEMFERTAAGETVVRRLRVRAADGAVHWVEVHAKLFYNAAGDPDGRTASIRIVDAEVAAEHELAEARRAQAESDALYREVLGNAAVGMCVTSPEGDFEVVNEALCEFFGYDADALRTKSWQEVTAPEFLPKDLANVEEMLAGRLDRYRITKQFIHADGQRVWGDLSVSCLRGPDGDMTKFIAQIVDVTAEVEAREQAEAARRLMTASADSMLDPQVLLEAVRDPDGKVRDFRYVSTNLATLAYLRVAQQELLGQSALETLPNLEGSGLLARYAQCLADGDPVFLTDFSYFNEMIDDDRRYDIRATRAGPELLSLTWSDVTERYQAAQRIAASEETYRLIAENAGDVVSHVRDDKFVWVSPSVEDVLGAPPDYWLGRGIAEILPAGNLAAHAARWKKLSEGGVIQQRVQVKSLDGATHWVHLYAKPFYGADGLQDGVTASFRVIDAEVAAQQAVEAARRKQAAADALYRRSMDSAAVGMCLALPDGSFLDVNDSLCEFFGYDAETLMHKTWIELTAPDYLNADLDNVADLVAGRTESYRMVKQYIHADGHLIWGDLAVGCVRDDNDQVEILIAQVADITAEVESREQLDRSERKNRALAKSLQSELDSAAGYLRSVLPGDLAGTVTVSSLYMPSQTLGGDCFDYLWIDDDHLVVYLLDVSGHGVESALIAVSVHNLLRSHALPDEVLLNPDQVLTKLNEQFAMDHHDFNYFTIFYGVYQPSTGTLRYANAGHPPSVLFADDQVTGLPSQSPPVGMLSDVEFTVTTVPIPSGGQLLLYSDGAYELPLDDGGQWSHEDFLVACKQLAGSPGWTLDGLAETLRRQSVTGEFVDDCCLLRVTFP